MTAGAGEGGPPRLHLAADGYPTVTLQRPRHRNRQHREDLLALQAQFAQAAADPAVRLPVLTATGPVFCAGFHLGELEASSTQDAASADPQLFEHTVDALEALPLPTVARLNGSACNAAHRAPICAKAWPPSRRGARCASPGAENSRAPGAQGDAVR